MTPILRPVRDHKWGGLNKLSGVKTPLTDMSCITNMLEHSLDGILVHGACKWFSAYSRIMDNFIVIRVMSR